MDRLEANFIKVQRDKDKQNRREMEKICQETEKDRDVAKKGHGKLKALEERYQITEKELVQLHEKKNTCDERWDKHLKAMQRNNAVEIKRCDRVPRRETRSWEEERSVAPTGGLMAVIGGGLDFLGIMTGQPLIRAEGPRPRKESGTMETATRETEYFMNM